MRKDLIAMVRQLGPPSLFFTMSSNDRHWPEVMKRMLELELERPVTDAEVSALDSRHRLSLKLWQSVVSLLLC